MPHPKKVLLLGASGLLGSSLKPFLQLSGFDVLAPIRNPNSGFDIRNRGKLRELLVSYKPSAVINLIGLTSVDSCETNKHGAFTLNSQVPQQISELLDPKCKFIQVSTDHVYDSPHPSRESEIRAVNNYAVTKLAGELSIQHENSVVLRTNFLGPSLAPGRQSMTDWLLGQYKEGQPIRVLKDVTFSPLSIESLIRVITQILESPITGTFNSGCTGFISKAEFDREFFIRLGLSPARLQFVRLSDLGLIARRPRGMAMDSSKLGLDLGVKLPSVDEMIDQVVRAHR